MEHVERDPESVQAVCFELSGCPVGMPIEQVAEVVDLLPVTPLFRTPPWLVGIAGLRGEILEIVDLALVLGLPPAKPTPSSRVLVVQQGGRRWGVVVDAVLGVRTLVPEQGGSAEGEGQTRGLVARDGDFVATLLNAESLAELLLSGSDGQEETRSRE